MVQNEMQRRIKLGPIYLGNNIFNSKLICGDCGGFYGPKAWHSNDPRYKKVIFRCNRKYEKDEPCKTPTVSEDEIKEKFVKAYNKVMVDKNRLIEDANELKAVLTDTSKEEEQITALQAEIEVISGLADKLVKENSSKLQDQKEYEKKYNELSTRYESAKSKLNEATGTRDYKLGQALRIDAFIASLADCTEFLNEWSSVEWNLIVESATINRDKSVKFKFKNGTEITIE